MTDDTEGGYDPCGVNATMDSNSEGPHTGGFVIKESASEDFDIEVYPPAHRPV